jgi:hypothetical protein
MKNIIILIAFFLFLSKSHSYPQIPDITISPGHICTIDNPDFQEFRYNENIPYCKRNVSKSRKSKIYEIYKISIKDKANFTIDHIIPLSLGGSNSNLNLWPEHKKIKATRPNLEICLYYLLKDNLINQEIAINFILIIKFKKRVSGFDPPTLSLLKGCLDNLNQN